jgi:hypothetical protein
MACTRAIDGVAAGTAMVDSNGSMDILPIQMEVMNPVPKQTIGLGNIDTDRMLSTVYETYIS